MNLRDKIFDYLKQDRRRSIDVPEFGEKIYFTPITVLEMEKVLTLSNSGANSKDFHVWTIIEKAEDSEGRKIFDIKDQPFLEKMDWSIISRISNQIRAAAPVEEVKKTSKETPSGSASSPSPTEKAVS